MKVKFCGAAGEVTGSSHLVTLSNGYKALLDCGLYQGDPEKAYDMNRQFEFDPRELDCVILSHAHIDHIGRLPKLVKKGFRGNVYATPATRSLALIMLLDSAKIQQYDYEYDVKIAQRKGLPTKHMEPLYTVDDVYKALSLFVTVGYNRWLKIKSNLSLYFREAGHILGSASICLKIKEEGKEFKLGFTGDIGRPSRPIIKNPEPMHKVDYLICESTYGGRKHESRPSEYKHLLDIITKTCVEKKGKLIIPAFSLGRTQEIVFMLDKMSSSGELPKIPVYVDSPLSVNATRVFRLHPECYDDELVDYIEFNPDPFGFNGLHYITDVNDSKAINSIKTPAIIISSSGMVNAGRVRHHVANNIENPNSTILIVGYCAPGTTGHALAIGKEEIFLFGDKKKVRADIEVMDSFSAHADEDEMIDFVSNQKKSVKKIFLVHGSDTARAAFTDRLSKEGFSQVFSPMLGDEVELD